MIDMNLAFVHTGDMQIQITGGVVEIDDADSPRVLQHSWYVKDNNYAISRIGGKLTRMHRWLIGAKGGEHVDHRNRNGLDNRRENLRVGGRSPNMWNSCKKDRGGLKETSSQYKGVNLDKRDGGWMAELWKFGRKIFTKKFRSELDAAVAYNLVAKKEFGEYALLNAVFVSEAHEQRVQSLVNLYKPRGLNKGRCIARAYGGKWTLRVRVSGKYVYAGTFDTHEAAEDEFQTMHINNQPEGVAIP